MKAKSIHGKSAAEILTALEKAISDRFNPSLAIVFISIKQDRKAVADLLHQNGMDVFGATSCGEFIDGQQSEGEIAILLLDISRDSYHIYFENIGSGSVADAAARAGQKALMQFKNPSLIVCSTGMTAAGVYFNGEEMVKSLEQTLGADKIFVGGMAGDDMTFTGTYIFTHDQQTDCGLAVLVLDGDKIQLSGMAITGWKPLGISRRVTKSIENRLYEIDGKPAVEMYLKYLGKEEKQSDKDFNVFEELGYTYPFITERKPGREMILRSPIKIDHKENALLLDVGMPEGTRFFFSTPPDFDIVDEILNEATQLKNEKTIGADALLIFSCAGRPPVLGPLVTAENNGLADIWKAPMAGFFTYGEYGRAKMGNQEFHSGACCWVALKEKK